MNMRISYFILVLLNTFLLNPWLIALTRCSSEEERLIKTLFKGYNKLIRPVRNSSDHVVITMDLVLLQLINVYEKDQVMKTNVWINLKWRDFQFEWSSKDYKVGSVRVPPERVWTPDIVLFNNADGNYEASYKPNILLYGDMGENETNIMWIPPAIYKSSCTIDVRYFPFDEQLCEMRFGSWTFDAQQVKLKRDKPLVNLEDYLPSGTWDVIEVPGYETYSKETNRMELVYKFRIRRKTLFYTVNLIIPTVLISFLSIFVFYLPTDEGEKMTLCISILLALVVFLLLVSKILPPTSMVIPLISKYLIFTLMMNIVTILNTVIIINWNYRTPRTHTMPKWIKSLFIEFLPKILFMTRPKQEGRNSNNSSRNGSSHNSKDSLAKTSCLIDKFNRQQQQHAIAGSHLSTPPPLSGNALTAVRLSKSQNINNNNKSTSIDSTGDNLSLINKKELNITNQVQILQSGAAFDCSTNSVNQRTPPLKLRETKHHHNSSSNSNLDLTLNSNQSPQLLMQQQQRSKTPQLHLQHRHLDKMTNTKRALFKNMHQNEALVTLKTSINNDHNEYEKENENDFENSSCGGQKSMPTSPTSLSRHNRHTNHHNSKNSSSYSAGQSIRHRRRIEQQRRIGFGGDITPTKSKSFDDENDDYEEEKNSLRGELLTDRPIEFSPEIIEAADKVTYITNHIKSENDYEEMRDDWKYVALVIDRIMLYIFFSVTVIGTAFILFDAPHIFEFVDQQAYLDKLISANKF